MSSELHLTVTFGDSLVQYHDGLIIVQGTRESIEADVVPLLRAIAIPLDSHEWDVDSPLPGKAWYSAHDGHLVTIKKGAQETSYLI